MNAPAAEIEPILRALITAHGLAKLQRHLAPLLKGAKWSDWQTISNVARNVAAQLEREKALTTEAQSQKVKKQRGEKPPNKRKRK